MKWSTKARDDSIAGGSVGDFSGGNLIWIIHNANESGYR